MLRSETAASPKRRSCALAGLARFQAAPRLSRPPEPQCIASAGRARLIDFGGAGSAAVFVPSLINPPLILDLGADNSLLRWLATQGVRPLLVDWGTPDAGERDLDIGGHVDTLLLPLLATLDDAPHLIGYCLGGTIAIAAAAQISVQSLTLIAAPWRFDGFGSAARAAIAELWAGGRASCDAIGLVPIELLQSGFWRLDPAKTIAKYERFAATEPGSAAAQAFVTLEDWANAGAPLTFAAGRELFEDFIGCNLPGSGGWRGLDPAALPCPVLDIISTTDRIVPAASATRVANRRLLGAGHVGMIAGSRARAELWEPLRDWLSRNAST